MKFVVAKKALMSENIVIPEYFNYLAESDFNKIAIQFGHGATLFGIGYANPKPAWSYEFVDTIPNTYIKAGQTTTEKAYAFTQKIIQACYKANRLPYEQLKEIYKEVYRIIKDCCKSTLRVYSPNPTTALEVYAENAFLEDLASTSLSPNYQRKFTDEALDFYCRAFQLDRSDDYYMTFAFQRTQKNGKTFYAQLPYITKNPLPRYSGKSKTSGYGYAGNTLADGSDVASAPYTLLKDAHPTLLPNNYVKTLEESVEYFLALPAEVQTEFLSANFIMDPGTHQLIELDVEQVRAIRTAQQETVIAEIYKGHIAYQTADGEVVIS